MKGDAYVSGRIMGGDDGEEKEEGWRNRKR